MATHPGPCEPAEATGELIMLELVFGMVRFTVAMVAILMWLVLCIVGVLLMLIVWPLFVIALFL